MQISKYPEATYRVSLKMIVRDSNGHVLVVKENGSNWSLPGGGIDHGERLEVALARELYEEVLIDQPFTYEYIGMDTFYVANKERWQMWLVYKLTIEDGYVYGVGVDADEVAFINPRTLKGSTLRSEQLVYKWTAE